MKSQIAISSLIWTSSVFAHTIFQRVHVNGVDQGYLKGVRHPTYNGPITDVTSNDIICNGGPNPLVTPYPTDIINIPAGSPAAIQYNNVLQPNGWDSTNPADPVDPSHKGPVMVYMAKVPSALQTDVTGLGWFKVFEDGYDGSQWGVDRMVANHGIVNFTVPACIPPGNYFLRAEMIALHPASSYPGAQFYPGCAQVNIVGGGSTQPSTVSLPGAYHGTDPGITINIYYPPVTNYTIPGPRPFTCNGSSGSTTRSSTTTSTSSTTTKPSSSTTSSSSPRTTTTSTRTSSTTTSTTSAVGGYASHYAQCGGIGYTGPTVCESPYTCKYSSDYYSQCL